MAKEDINAGDVIAVENANVSFTHYNNESQESKACHHCVCPLDVFKHPSPVVPGIYFCSWKCLRIAMKSYHKHEKNILNDYIKQCAQDEKIERSGVLFLALKAVAKMPWQFYCDNSRSELFMKTDPKFGLEMNKDELDKDETKIIHLFNLVTHESEIPSLERTKTAVRSIILLESLKQTDYFKVNKSTQKSLQISKTMEIIPNPTICSKIPITIFISKSLKNLYSGHSIVSSKKTNFETSLNFKLFS